MQLRPYQKEAVHSVLGAIKRGVKRPAVVLATGGGKTVVFSHLIPLLQPHGKRGDKTLILAHKEELVRQAARVCQQINPELSVQIDMAALKSDAGADVVVASVPTLYRQARLHRHIPEDYKSIIIDECHHAPASSWLKVLEYFGADTKDTDVNVVGFTATLERADGQALGKVFDEVVFERNLLTMVQNKELVDVKFLCLDTEVDLSSIKIRRGDYDTTALSEEVNRPSVNMAILRSYQQLSKQYGFKSTLIFCVNIEHSRTVCGVLQEHGVNAQYVTGLTNKHERVAIIDDFRNGRIQVLVNVQVFTEGTDLPNIDSLILARPTKSRPLLVQMIGRGLRLHEGKDVCHVVDLVNTRGTGMQSVPTLLGLPPHHEVEGKSILALLEEAEMLEKLKANEQQRLREEGDLLYKMRQLNLDLQFSTFEGFAEAEGASETKSHKEVAGAMKRSSIKWLRVDPLVWLWRYGFDCLFLFRGIMKDGKPFYTLEDHGPASPSPFVTYKHKSGRPPLWGWKKNSTLESGHQFSVVLARAEVMARTRLDPKFARIKRNQRMPTEKQLEMVEKILVALARKDRRPSDEELAWISRKVLQMKVAEVSNILDAYHYSVDSMYLRWTARNMMQNESETNETVPPVADVNELVNSLNDLQLE